MDHYYFEGGRGKLGNPPQIFWTEKKTRLKKNLQGEHTLLPTKKIHAQPKGEKKKFIP